MVTCFDVSGCLCLAALYSAIPELNWSTFSSTRISTEYICPQQLETEGRRNFRVHVLEFCNPSSLVRGRKDFVDVKTDDWKGQSRKKGSVLNAVWEYLPRWYRVFNFVLSDAGMYSVAAHFVRLTWSNE
jgi:hypothetical protein